MEVVRCGCACELVRCDGEVVARRVCRVCRIVSPHVGATWSRLRHVRVACLQPQRPTAGSANRSLASKAMDRKSVQCGIHDSTRSKINSTSCLTCVPVLHPIRRTHRTGGLRTLFSSLAPHFWSITSSSTLYRIAPRPECVMVDCSVMHMFFGSLIRPQEVYGTIQYKRASPTGASPLLEAEEIGHAGRGGP